MLLFALIALGTAPAPGTPSASTTETRSFSGMGLLALGRAYEAKGNAAGAMTLYRALANDRDPQVRGEALARQAQLLAKRGDRRGAATALRRLLDQQPEAGAVRVSLASLLQSMGDEAAARRELRAAAATRLTPELARLVDRFQAMLAATKPFGASIDVAIAPDSNINRATQSATLSTVIGDFRIDPGSRPRSGTGLALRGQAYARLALSDRARLVARLSSNADLYRDKMWNDITREASVGAELGIDRGLLTIEAGIARRSIGGTPVQAYRRLGGTFVRPIGSRTQVRLGVTRLNLDNRLNDLQDGRDTQLSIGVERALSARTRVGLNLSGEHYSASEPAYSTRSWRAGLFAAHELGRGTLLIGAEAGRLGADERLALFPERRRDRSLRLSAGYVFRRLTVVGFAPSIRVTRERNHSSIEIYDYSRTRTEFGISRAF